MALLDENEQMVRKWLIAAGVDVDPSKTDPEERITYPDYRRLWVSRANRPEGKLLATLLIGLAAVVLIGAMILFGSDSASSTVLTMQYVFLGLGAVAVIGALWQMRGK